ncbi:MAG: rhodanese-like domain-containing protein [Victivallaceae bacterium]|nr:rhodanese-like domain-containing protein [Victivallaceae bacterium]
MWWIIAVFIIIIVLKQILMHNISIDNACEKLKNGAILIDVRTPSEFSGGHHSGAVNVPLDNLDKITAVVEDKNSSILLYCHSGARAAAACSRLRRMGYSDVSNIGSYSRTRKAVDKIA